MPPFDRHLWRLAGRLADRIAKLEPQGVPISLDNAAWLSARRLESRLDEIAGRNWPAAGDHLRLQFQSTVRCLQNDLGNLLQQMPPLGSSPRPLQRPIYEELLAASDEFEDFEFDLREQTLSVTTSEITLEDVLLGRFKILLNLTNLTNYRVIARSPNRASCSSNVTHPHVLEDELCEGDGAVPLAFALRTGRLSDFFQIIEQTLQTYNAGSAYVSLHRWSDEVTCHSCGDHVSEDASRYCDACNETVCEDCSRTCPHCDNCACDSCIQHCPKCREQTCSGCRKPCRRCRSFLCPDCLTESLCETCHAIVSRPTASSNASSRATLSPAAAPVAPVFSDRVGEALVPA